MRIEKLRAEHGAEIRWVHFPLHTDTPDEGRSLEELFAGRGYDVADMQAQMKARMEAEGLPYGTRTHTYNSRLAQELGKWAETQPGGGAIHDALFRAYFVETQNIAAPEVLLDVAEGVGLDREAAREVIHTRSFKEAVDEDWARAHAHGIRGVPSFVAGGYLVVGAQPYEVLEKLVAEARTNPFTPPQD